MIAAMNLPDELAQALHTQPSQVAEAVTFAAAVRMYEQGALSIGLAAKLAGMDSFAFADRLADQGIPNATFDPQDAEAARRFAVPM